VTRRSDRRQADRQQSIPTLYRGITFRSKLEADWARAFDALGVAWEFEKIGQYFGPTFYLVDFWLPRSRQYVECKAVLRPGDLQKIDNLTRYTPARAYIGDDCPDITIVLATPGGEFFGLPRRGHGFADADKDMLERRAVAVALFACARCAGRWFADPDGSWQCQCCGAADGRRHLSDAPYFSPLVGWPLCPALTELAG
jgi:hypothetical protein